MADTPDIETTTGTKSDIIIAGQRFPLPGGIPVVTWEDADGLSFPAKVPEALAATGSNLFTERVIKGNVIRGIDDLVGKVDQIVIHTDLSQDSPQCFQVLVGRGLSTHFMVNWDGTIYQGLDPLFVAYHAGEANKGSIGIDFNNMMLNLEREPDAPMYYAKHPRYAEMQKKEFRRPKSERMTINGGKVRSYGYTDPQFQSLIALIKVLCDVLDIPKECPFDAKGEIVTEVLADPGFRGFIAHWHVSPDRWDPGPGFDWQRVYFGLRGEYNSFPLLLDGNTNINTLLEPQKVKDYAENYYTANESKGNGGWYPMGINQTWHGGIHIPGKKDEPVHAMFDGFVVAARFGNQATKLGHNNFILLKHIVPIPNKAGGEPRNFEFFTLYMHLAPIDFRNVNESSPKWLQEMVRLDAGKTEGGEAEFEDKKKPEGEEGEGGEGGEDGEGKAKEFEDEGQEIVEGDWDKKSRWLEVSNGLGALRSGKVAKVPYKDAPLKVRAADVIASLGVFGTSPDEWTPQLHVEIFADPAKDWKEAVNLSIHGRHLIELDDDVGTDLFVENAEILGLFGASRGVGAGALTPQKVLSSSDIQGFFTAPGEFVEEKRYLHKVVVRHVSEWSDAVDWVTALSKAEGWDAKIGDFRTILRGSSLSKDAISTVLPWIWLSKDVAEHIGLEVKEWHGILDHFHPIQFLIWLTFHSSQRIQAISRGVSPAKLKKLKAEAEAKAVELRFQERVGFETSFFVQGEVEEQDAGKALDRWLREWDQGEWERTFNDEG